ncbi:MAG: RIP metalloprotease RseP [Longimicrobiales bacterium]|nr:RIP metalloprotease RseP [Longimicrobiales bacterium]
MTTILATIIVLGVLIFVHELGHFWAAKLVDIEVERFSIGFGPRLWGFQRGETEYVLSAIPLGGYVKMGGMEDEVMEHLEGGATEGEREPGPRDFDAKPVWARAFVISAGVVMNMLFAYVGYTFGNAVLGQAVLDTVRVGTVMEEVLPDGAASLASIPEGAVIETIGGQEVRNWGDVQEALIQAQPGPLAIEVASPDQTVTVDIPADEGLRERVAGALQYWMEPRVGQVVPGSPADEAGLEGGDVITAVDGEAVETWWDLVDIVEDRAGQETRFTLQRDGRELVRIATPDEVTTTDPVTGEEATVGQIGINSAGGPVTYERVSLSRAAVLGAQETWGMTVFILEFLRDLVTGGVSPRNVGSIVTIGQASGEFFAQGIVPFVRFMALFSINLAILNLLPIPVLDGGHLVFLGIEAVRGDPVSIEQRLRWSQVGFFILVGLMIWALSNDVLRLLGM